MSTATLHAPTVGADQLDTVATKGKGFFSRVFEAMIEAQHRRAQRVAFAGLSQLPDHQLIELGYKPEQVEKIRRYQGTAPYWC